MTPPQSLSPQGSAVSVPFSSLHAKVGWLTLLCKQLGTFSFRLHC